MTLPLKVKIVEVGPRDGLQNEKALVDTDIKIDFINQLSETGLSSIEIGSFVSPKAIFQLQDSVDVALGISRKKSVTYSALVPNEKGLKRALDAKVNHIAIFGSASETFSQKNINCSIDESIKRFEKILSLIDKTQITVRAYISCVLGCPYEGKINKEKVVSLAKTFYALGVDEISLGDTIGIGTPKNVQSLIDTVAKHIPLSKLAMHFHNTYGQAIANIYASLECGITVFDSSVAGLGGCPYAKGATGNVPTEDVLFLMQGLNIETGVDLKKLIKTGHFISNKLGRINQSFVANASH